MEKIIPKYKVGDVLIGRSYVKEYEEYITIIGAVDLIIVRTGSYTHGHRKPPTNEIYYKVGGGNDTLKEDEVAMYEGHVIKENK